MLTQTLASRFLRGLCALSILAAQAHAGAALSVTGTRFIFPAGTASLAIQVGNTGQMPLLLQAWLDRGDAHADLNTLYVPFVLTPPIVRIDPGTGIALQIRRAREALPDDRESLFWINFLEIPPKPNTQDAQHRIRIAYRLRMKMLYRPAALSGNSGQAIAQLRWHARLDEAGRALILEARNDTPYFVSFAALQLQHAGQTLKLGALTVPPFSAAPLRVPAHVSPSGSPTLYYEAADDAGDILRGQARIDLQPAPRS